MDVGRACAGAAGVRCNAKVERHPSTAGWTASDLEAAYALPSADRGLGQTVFIVDAYDNPNVASDFAEYRSAMGLPAGKLTKYNQRGRQNDYPQGNADWGVESDLDVEMVSASCPNCAVKLVEADSATWSDLSKGVEEAVRLGATVVSTTFAGEIGVSEKAFRTPGVTFVAAAAADAGGIAPPAAFDTVVAVGGTVLAKASNQRGYTETVWSQAIGGCVGGESKPKWQVGNKYAKACRGRMADDVSAVAQGVAMYDSYSQGGWLSIDGTSIGAPFCAGVFALAGNATKQRGGRTFWVPASHHRDLFEVGSQRYSDGGGWGSPDGSGAF
jgi:subtilase family serine protease